MPTITFQPMGIETDASPGTPLLDAARAVGIEIHSPCGGEGTCGKCIVRVLSGEVDSDGAGVLSRSEVADGYVLACRAKALAQDIVIEVPDQAGWEGGKFTDASEDAHLVRKELLPQKWDYDPLAVKWFIEVPEAQLEDGLSDLERLTRAIQRQWGKMDVRVGLPVLRRIAGELRKDDGRVTATLIRDEKRLFVVGIEAGDTTVRHYGIAVDIGTTTLAVQLVYLPLAEVVATRSGYNDQIACGLDVISRINYAKTPERLEELRKRVLNTLNQLVHQVCESHDVQTREVVNAVISGNTTMTHLLLGLNPEYIRLAPYTPTLAEAPFLTAEEVGVDINPESWVCLSPSVGSYVGGDITAGLLCTDLAAGTEDVSLFIDIGTNGEIVVGNEDFLLTCACSAGPAFEGGGIGCGMRASLGAIERVEVDPDTGLPTFSTIGESAPKGICGSGMITLLASLFTTGWLDAAGKLDRTRRCSAISAESRHAAYTLATAEQTGAEPLIITELDIQNIIRAKAAIYSACCLLLEQVGLTFDDLANVYIAGGFGRFLDLEKATVLGLIPDLPAERFHYIGNASLMGSYMVLVSRDFRQRQLDLARRMTYMELNTNPSYMDQYTGALFLPHTDPDRFPSVTQPKQGTNKKN
ncbi:MAG: DUF4445 domain-containing protein [Lentisphaeria bacterium]|nr:DUF4445 domain-containing protein [Lentisphaeria bacterium]